jgi:hypothetical protein
MGAATSNAPLKAALNDWLRMAMLAALMIIAELLLDEVVAGWL